MLFKWLSTVCLFAFAFLSIGTFADDDSNCRLEADPCFYAELELLRQGKWCIGGGNGISSSCFVQGEHASVSCSGGYRKITPSEQADLEAEIRKIEIENLNKQRKDCPKKKNNEDESAATVS